MGCFVLANVNDVICVSVAYPLRMGCVSLAVWQEDETIEMCDDFNNLHTIMFKDVVLLSFFAEGFDGFDGEGAGGGEESGEQANEYQQDKGADCHRETDLHGAEHFVVLQQHARQLHYADPGDDAKDTRKEGEEGAFCQYLADNDARARPEGAADTNLFGALADRDEHDVADANCTRDERADAD